MEHVDLDPHVRLRDRMTRAGWGWALLVLAEVALGCGATHYPRPVYPSSAASISPGVPADADLRAIEHQYARLARAFGAMQVDSILAVRSPEFSATPPGAPRQDAAQMREVLNQFFAVNKPPIHTWLTIRSAERLGADTIRVVIFQQASRYQDLAGKRRLVEHDVTQDETWRREEGVWKLYYVGSVREKHRWVDGKPIDPSKPFDPKAPPYIPPATP